MSFNGAIDQAWDIQALEKEQQKAVDLVKEYLGVVTEASKASRLISVDFKGVDTLAGLAEMQTKSQKATQDHKKAVQGLTVSLREYEKVLKQRETLQAKLNTLDSDASKEAARLREEIKNKTAAYTEEIRAKKLLTEDERRLAIQRGAAAKVATEEAKAGEYISRAKTEEAKQSVNLARQKDLEAAASLKNEKAKTEESKQSLNVARQTDIETRAAERAARQKEQQRKSIDAAEGSLDQMRYQLRQMVTEYDALSRKERENLQIGGALLKQLLAQDAAVKKLEEGTGRHQRSVGNYAKSWDGLSFSMMQLVRETPSLANGLNVYFSAISNNAPQAAEHIMQTIRLNRQLRAEGKETVSVGVQLGKAIFNWQTGLVLGLTLLTLYSKDIYNFFTGVGEYAKKATEVNKKYVESIKEISATSAASINTETSKLKTLNAIATDTTLTINQRKAAALEMQKTYPATLGYLQQEAILEGKVADKIKETIAAIIARAKAAGSEKKLEAASLRESELDILYEQAYKKQNEYTAFLKKNVLEIARAVNAGERVTAERALEIMDRSGADTDGTFTSEMKSRIAEAERLRQARNQARIEMNAYANEVLEYTRELRVAADGPPEGSIAELRKQIADIDAKIELAQRGSDNLKQLIAERKKLQAELDAITNKDKAGRRPTDTTNSEISAQERLNSANAKRLQTQLLAENNYYKLVFENQNNSLDMRLEALDKYWKNRIILNNQQQDLEAANIKVSLDKIAAIEQIDESKRTGEQIKLLEQKQALQAELLALTEEYCVKENDIITDAARERTQIESQNMQMLAEVRKNGIDRLNQNVAMQYEAELKGLVDKLEQGKISNEKYQNDVQALNAKYGSKTVDETIAYLQDILDNEKLTANERQDLQKLLDDARVKSAQLANDKIINDAKRLNDALKALQQELLASALSISQSISQRQQMDLDKQIKQAQEKSETSIEIIERDFEKEEILAHNKYATEEERAKALEQIQLDKLAAITAAEQSAANAIFNLEEEKKRKQIAQAQLEKKLALAKSIIETLAASTEALPNIPLSITIASIGALKTAAIAATPIAYKFGTPEEGHPADGPAIVGDGFEQELIEEPGKAPYWSPDRPTLINLKKGAHVTPKSKMLEIGNKHLGKVIVLPAPTNDSEMKGLRADFQKVAKNMANIQQTTIIHKADEVQRISKTGAFGSKTLRKAI